MKLTLQSSIYLNIWRTATLSLLLAALSAATALASTRCPSEASVKRPTFALQFGDEVSPYGLISAFRLPGQRLAFSVLLATPAPERFTACLEGSSWSDSELETMRLLLDEPGSWSVDAPSKPGFVDVVVRDALAGEAMTLRLFALRPYDGASRIGDFKIGGYEQEPLRGLENYRPPKGFLEVGKEQRDVALSPNFKLGQFLSKQTSSYPKYALVSSRILLKLERLLETVQASGIDASTFTILSGFRTPWYNRSIGNTTKYSRHLYGDALDIYIDQDSNGRMDDIDGNGKVDYADASKLAKIIEGAAKSAWYRPFVGGLGIYGPAPHRGPFVHIDTRGYKARWTAP